MSLTRELPLAAAQRRLGRPGRPRKTPPVASPNGASGVSARQTSTPSITSAASTRACDTDITVSAPSARLLSTKNAARYLGVSTWVAWRLIKDGTIKPVTIPGIKRTLVDRIDLDALVARWKAP